MSRPPRTSSSTALSSFPESESWLHPFLDVVANFTGNGKEIDDDVDALGNAFEALRTKSSGKLFSSKSSRN